jgi:AraC family ethanolamine operon transcriptional activator
VQKLVEETGVSVRTLEYSFLERFGTSPKAVLKSLRLSGANRELISTVEGSIQISDIATRWGFWHMGQFAKDYKKMFGELPSETLT